MNHYVSDCCGASVYYNENDTLHCQACGEECAKMKAPPTKEEIAIRKAEQRADR
jgi:hypothetical protein